MLFTLLHKQHVNDVCLAARDGNTVELGEAPQLTVQSNAIPSLALHDLEGALAEAATAQREAILLVGFEGQAYEEVATVLIMPVGTVRSRRKREASETRLCS